MKTLFDLLETDSKNEEKDTLILSIEHEVGRAFRQKDIYTHEFSLEVVCVDSFVFTGHLEKMPKLYTGPILSVTFKCDDDLVKSGGNGYLSGHYQFLWSMKKWVNGKEYKWVDSKYNEPGEVEVIFANSPYLQLHIGLKKYEVKFVHINDVHYYLDEEDANKLLIPSRDIQEWYDRYENFGPTLDSKKLPPFITTDGTDDFV